MDLQQWISKAAALCSKSEYCTSQIREKLRRWGAEEEEIGAVIQRLEDEKYIDNLRFCKAYANDKFRYAHWGRIKIRQGLRYLGLPCEDIEEGLMEIDEEEYLAALRNILRQKNRSIHDEDAYSRRAKLVRHAASKGFETDLIMDLTESLEDD